MLRRSPHDGQEQRAGNDHDRVADHERGQAPPTEEVPHGASKRVDHGLASSGPASGQPADRLAEEPRGDDEGDGLGRTGDDTHHHGDVRVTG